MQYRIFRIFLNQRLATALLNLKVCFYDFAFWNGRLMTESETVSAEGKFQVLPTKYRFRDKKPGL
jgi:hypothetical protein